MESRIGVKLREVNLHEFSTRTTSTPLRSHPPDVCPIAEHTASSWTLPVVLLVHVNIFYHTIIET
jgi:hypothetical protein